MAGGQGEDALEEAVMGRLAELGWETVDGYEEELGAEGTLGRDAQSEPVLGYRLQAAVERLNPDVPASAVTAAVDEFCEIRKIDPVRANYEKWKLLREGARVTVPKPDGSDETFRVRFVDWDIRDANEWLAVSQFWMDGLPNESEGVKRPDVIGFVNGIPLLFVELKAPNIAVKDAYTKNLTDYRKQIPALFHFNGVLLLSNGPDTKIGSTYANWEHFAEWKKVHDEAEPGQLSLEVALEAVAEPSRLLDIVENFIAFIEMPGGLVKVVAKNHQYLGVNKAFDAYQDRKPGDGRLGVFWHTQGSGKSLSMLFFTQKVLRKVEGHPTFVLVTDRIELDDQLFETFTDAGVINGPHVQADSSAHLRQLLTEDHRYIFTLIHKFQPERDTEMPVLSDRDDIVVITDEAHRSQYDTLAMNMRTGLPNARFLGFTGTPLIDGEERTREVFGDYVSVYNFADSINDGATVPLYYENRIPELQITDQDAFTEELEELLEAAELDDAQEAKLARQFSRQYHLITRQDRLEKIAEDLVEHFSTRGFRGKAMYVAIDKVTAVRMYDLVTARWQTRLSELETQLAAVSDDQQRAELESRVDFMSQRKTDMAVVVSHSTGEVHQFEEHNVDIGPHRQRMVKEDLDTKFKDPDDPFRLVFVCAMWLTGFDVPTCSTIYLDKPMRNHSLMQTIARANRVYPEKQSGLIVDYVGIFHNLERALAIYGTPTAGGGSDGEPPVLPKEELVTALDEAVVDITQLLTAAAVSVDDLVNATGFEYAGLLDDAAEQVLAAGGEFKTTFTNKVARARRIYRAVLPDPGAHQHNKVMSTLAHLVDRIGVKSPTGDIDDVMSDVNALLDRSIAAEGYLMPVRSDEERLVDLSDVDWGKLAEQFKGRVHTAADQIQRLLAERITQAARINPTLRELVDRLEKLIDDYNDGSLNIEELLERLRRLAGDLDEHQQRVAAEEMTEKQLAVFDLLTRPEPDLSDTEQAQVKQVARELFSHIEEALVLDWQKTQSTRALVKVSIETHLDQLPDAYDRDLFRKKAGLIYDYVTSIS